MRLAPITVLFGTNSAGKTSIPQLLLLLKQTAESSDRQRVLHFGDSKRTPIELGDSTSVVHNHDVDSALTLSLGWRSTATLAVRDPLSERAISSDRFRFDATFEADTRRNPFVRVVVRDRRHAGKLRGGHEPERSGPCRFHARRRRSYESRQVKGPLHGGHPNRGTTSPADHHSTREIP